MTYVSNGFANRLKTVERKRARLARGYECKVGSDGLIVFRPKRRHRSLPVRGVLLMMIGFFGFKGVILAQIGSAVYQQRVDALAEGSWFEQFGSMIMQIDPIATEFARLFAPFL